MKKFPGRYSATSRGRYFSLLDRNDVQIESLGDNLGRLDEDVLRKTWGSLFACWELIFSCCFVGSRLWVEIFLRKEGISKKGCVEIEDWGFSVHFVLGFQGNSIHTLLFRFSYDIAQWCKVYTKTRSCFQKSHDEFGQLQTSSQKSKKLKLDGLLFSKIHSFSKNIIYRGFI